MDREELAGLVLLGALGVTVLVSSADEPLARPLPELALLALLTASWGLGRRVAESELLLVITPVLLAVGIVLAVALSAGVPSEGHTAGLLGYGNANGALCVLGAGAAALTALQTQDRGLLRLGWTTAIAATALALATSSVTSSILALLVLATATSMHLQGDHMGRQLAKLGQLAPASALLGSVSLTLAYSSGHRGLAIPVNVTAYFVSERRLILWSEAVGMATAAPLVGSGAGTFGMNSEVALLDQDAAWAHSLVLQQAAELGLPGAVLTVALGTWLLLSTRAVADGRLRALVTVMVGATLVHANFDYIAHFAVIPVLLVFITASMQNTRGRSRAVSPRTLA